MGHQRVQRGGGAAAQSPRLGKEALHRLRHRIAFQRTARAMQVGGKRDIAQLRQHRAAPPHIAANAVGFMHHQYCGPIRGRRPI
jgi:hypothetical protein